ncbi:hypothetical protein DSM112329_04638 [Paraconexibacter sp. AEG42_29]|uniref:Mce/MlaD domain-containing protein n=1 Tax=Paraconexibacter sp. AEG42_29 TaxID=2997339 RepID=A0AAU7B1B0_9ACTN
MGTKIPHYRRHSLAALALVLTAGSFFFVCLYLGGGLPTFGKTYSVKVVLPTVASLTPGSRVTMSGAEVGTVKAVDRDGVGAIVRLELTDDRVFPLPVDSTVRLRQHTPVGENYVSIEPGRSATTLASGATVPIKQAGEFVDVDQVLSTLSGPTQKRARSLIRATGGALEGRGEQLNGLVRGVTGTINPFADVVHIGYTDRRQVSRLVQQLGRVTAAIGEREAAIGTVSRKGLTSLRAIAAKDEALERLIADLPATLGQVRKTSGTVGRVTDRATPVVLSLATAVRQVRPAVRALRPAASEGRGVVRELGAAAPPLEGTLARVRALSGPATKALPQLRSMFCQLNPMIRYLKPYTNDVVSTLAGLGSAANSYDAIGHVIRLVPLVSENELAGLPKSVSDPVFELMNKGILGKLRPLSFNPYPEPNQIGKVDQIKTPVNGPEGLAKSGWVYPRVTADCGR